MVEDIHAGRPAVGLSLRQIPTGGTDLGENTEMCGLRKTVVTTEQGVMVNCFCLQGFILRYVPVYVNLNIFFFSDV